VEELTAKPFQIVGSNALGNQAIRNGILEASNVCCSSNSRHVPGLKHVIQEMLLSDHERSPIHWKGTNVRLIEAADQLEFLAAESHRGGENCNPAYSRTSISL
jgi:hypothetical protein